MLPTCPDADLQSLASAIAQRPQNAATVGVDDNQRSLILAIKSLKRFLTTDARKLIQWAYAILRQRTPENGTAKISDMMARMLSDPVNEGLVTFVTESIAFCEATHDSVLDTLFDLGKESVGTSTNLLWLLCLVSEKHSQWVIPRIHEYLIIEFAKVGNPHLSASPPMNDAQTKLTVMGSAIISHLLAKQKTRTRQSFVDLLDVYFEMIHTKDMDMELDPNTPSLKLYCLSYILALPKISPAFVNECWSAVFKRLFEKDSLGDMFLYERDTRRSMVRTTAGNVEPVFKIFPSWLYSVAFDRGGLIMKHAIDVSIVLDAMAHNPRLDLQYLMPSGDKSIIDSLRPSFEQLDLESASIDLVNWVISILGNTSSPRRVENLKIPLFLLQLVTLKENTPHTAVDTFVQLITKLQRPATTADKFSRLDDDGVRYVVLNLVAAAEDKWPGIFQTILERIFSKAIAMHIANSKGSVNVEKILANLAMLFEESKDEQTLSRPGFKAFQTYIAHHWRQVLLLFVNHPSMECRALGYRMLRHSQLWDDTAVNQVDPTTIAKLLVDAWFRHMKNRYLYSEKPEEASVLDELEILIVQCCQSPPLAKALLSSGLDAILGGALEIFPNVDFKALQHEKMDFLQKVQDMPFGDAGDLRKVSSTLSVIEAGQKRPPQFLVTPEYLRDELETQDKIYIDNIERTARLFYKYQELPNFLPESAQAISFHIFSHLSSKWPSSTASMDAYDDALPKNIPSGRDIAIGNAFKDYPVLFLILDKCSSMARFPMTDIMRSILVYFIAFWHIPQVVQAPTALKFATQLEETIRLIMLLEQMLPRSLVSIYELLPFMSAQDVGNLLYQALWPYIRSGLSAGTEIPGLGPAAVPQTHTLKEIQTLESKCVGRVVSICQERLEVLKESRTWHQALEETMARLVELPAA